MQFTLLFATFASFLAAGVSVKCYQCHLGNSSLYQENKFSGISLCSNSSSNHTKVCGRGCTKIEIQDRNRILIVFDCYNGFKKGGVKSVKNRTTITNIFSCYTDFCNGKIGWNFFSPGSSTPYNSGSSIHTSRHLLTVDSTSVNSTSHNNEKSHHITQHGSDFHSSINSASHNGETLDYAGIRELNIPSMVDSASRNNEPSRNRIHKSRPHTRHAHPHTHPYNIGNSEKKDPMNIDVLWYLLGGIVMSIIMFLCYGMCCIKCEASNQIISSSSSTKDLLRNNV